MAHEGQESISIGNYLLERLSQIGVQAGFLYLQSL
jgi:TPP-dependent 2-oxoacid decarboxylase